MSVSEADLLKAAMAARERAYAPYSRFKVGSLLLRGGRVISGGNVENVSFALTMCAERVAVGTAAQMGCTEFEVLALVSDSLEPITPCGACRQVLAEFGPELRIVSGTLGGQISRFQVSHLLPIARQGILG